MWQNGHISAQKFQIPKSTFIFWIGGPWAEIWPFCHFYESNDLEPNQENEKMAIYQPRGLQAKNKALCFLQLLKLEKAKCLYFYDLWLLSWVMAIFWYLFLLVDESLDWRRESAFIFWIWDLWAEIWPFCHFYESYDLEPNQENEKMVMSQLRGLQSKK